MAITDAGAEPARLVAKAVGATSSDLIRDRSSKCVCFEIIAWMSRERERERERQTDRQTEKTTIYKCTSGVSPLRYGQNI